MPEISIIIVNWNTQDLLATCINAIIETKNQLDIEIIVVDNASTDDSVVMLRESYPHVLIIKNRKNVGFAKANNQGFKISTGNNILLLNSDAILQNGSLQNLLQVFDDQPHCGLVGAQLLNVDGSFQASFTDLPNLWQEFLILSGLGRLVSGSWFPSHGSEVEHGPQPGGYVEGACMLIRREAYQLVEGLEEGYFMYSEDVELCKALQDNDWQVWYQPAAKVTHIGGGSSQQRRPQQEAILYQSRIRFHQRHYGNRKAQLLKYQVYFFTFIKNILYSVLRFVSRGRYGRPIVSLRYLASKFKEE